MTDFPYSHATRQRRLFALLYAAVVVVLLLGALGTFLLVSRGAAHSWFTMAADWNKNTVDLDVFPKWQAAIYGSGRWRREGLAVAVQTRSAPGGIYFRRTVDPSLRYIFTIRGVAQQGAANLRVKAD